jgi:hypothetical protein
MARTFCEASDSEVEPAGREPEAGSATAAGSGLGRDEVGGEVKDTLEGVERDVVVGFGFPNAGREDEAEFAAASFFVGVHERDEFVRMDVRPRRERA